MGELLKIHKEIIEKHVLRGVLEAPRSYLIWNRRKIPGKAAPQLTIFLSTLNQQLGWPKVH